MKIKKTKKKSFSKLLFTYGLHIWLLVFLLNVGIYYVVHFYTMGKTCFTPAQVQSDNRCLYIWSNKVYEKGSRSSPHMGHPCGSDITSVIPPTHMGNQAKYLLPNNVGDICTEPEVTPTPTVTPTQAPTLTPSPTTTLPSPTPTPTVTAVPSPTPTKPAAITATPTIPAPTLTIAPQVSLQPTVSKQNGGILSFAFILPGIGTLGANYSPSTPTRDVQLILYPPSVDLAEKNPPALATVNVPAKYNNNPSSKTYGSFEVLNASLGSQVQSGSYYLSFKTSQHVRSDVGIIQVKTGEFTTIAETFKETLAGDLNGDNTIDIIDYNLFADCYGSKVTQQTCSVGLKADLNDNAIVDGTDYILMLQGIQSLMNQGKVSPASQDVTPTVALPTLTPTPKLQVQTQPTIKTAKALAKPTIPPKKMTVRNPTATPAPTVIPPNPIKSLVAGENNIVLSKLLTYASVLLLVFICGIGILRSKLLAKVFHKSSSDGKTAKVVSPPVEVKVTVPDGKQQVTRTYYLSQTSNELVDGKYAVRLTDKSGSLIGYTPKLPPSDGYYDVQGYEDEIAGVLSFIIVDTLPTTKEKAS